jgi:hypothetical protein
MGNGTLDVLCFRVKRRVSGEMVIRA